MSHSSSFFNNARSNNYNNTGRLYRLVDQKGEHHPVLDDFYESIDSAWTAALRWWNSDLDALNECIEIGIEVSTSSGSLRTIRYPAG